MPIAGARSSSLIAAVACLLAGTDARADIIFCSYFPRLINIALAYPQANETWMSRGWLNLESGKCLHFDTTLNPRVFHYRGETEGYRNRDQLVRTTWGAGMQFAIKEGANFNYWNAQTKAPDSMLAPFNKGVDIADGVTSVTITFGTDGKVAVESAKP
jgi:Protein of unknown function (DUF1036)